MSAVVLGIAFSGLLLAALLIGWLPSAVLRRRADAAGITFTVPVASIAAVSSLSVDLSLLTNGDLTVVSVDPFEPDHERNLRWFAGALGHAATEPVGRAVARLSTRGRLSGVEEVPGVGISGSVDRHPVRIGTPDWLGVQTAMTADGASETDSETTTVVGVEVDAKTLGTITLTEKLRADAPDGVSALDRLGIATSVLPGTRPQVAQHLAEQVGLPIGTADVVADASGLSAGATLSDSSLSSVAHAISLARTAVSLKRACLVAGVVVGVLAVAGAVVLGLGVF